MMILRAIRAAFTPQSRHPVVQENDNVRAEIGRLKEQAERTIDAIDNPTGVVHQDMLEGRYRGIDWLWGDRNHRE